jgi:tRNA pseudouridine32 synthase/23S rRNA pseudouridine746 synthase
MNKQVIFSFKTDISQISIPEKLNNPFGKDIPEIARIAAKEFQDFITLESKNWGHDFSLQKGKMFGVLVVQKTDNSLGYLGTVSGKLSREIKSDHFAPSVFDDSVDDYFINKGMTELTEIGNTIKESKNPAEITALTAQRKQKSFDLQQQLFDNYQFLNALGEEQNVVEIFKNAAAGNPPSAAGDCAAPKLLHYAFKHQLSPFAISEFWWGNPPKNKEREHMSFYPACKDKCRPILEFILDDRGLFDRAHRA